MKLKFLRALAISCCCLLTLRSNAQAPNKFTYQAVIRNTTNALVANQSVRIRISLLQGSSVGSSVYTETHLTTTNANGLASIVIGNGTVVSGNINTVDWGSSSYFIKTEIDPTGGTTYSISSTTQLLSVPYALNAASSADNQWSKSGGNISNKNTGNVGIGTASPDEHFTIGDYAALRNEYMTIRTAGGNQFKAGLKFNHFNSNVGWMLESDESTNIFSLQHLNTNTKPLRMSFTDDLYLGDSVMIQNDEATRLILGSKKSNAIIRLGQSASNYFSLSWLQPDTLNANSSYANLATVGLNPLVLQAFGGKVGLSTITPAYKLDIVDSIPQMRIGTSNGAGGALYFGNNQYGVGRGLGLSTLNDSNDVSLYAAGTGSVGFMTNGNERMRILPNGNVGIGINTPVAQLELASTINNRKMVLWRNNDNDHQFYGFGINNNILRYQVDNTSANHVFYSASTATSSNELMRITGTGNVGIGTAIPATKLDVNGTTKTTSLQITSGAGLGKLLQSDATGNAGWVAPSTISGIPGTIASSFYSDGPISVISDSTGYQFIGATQSVTITAGQKIEVTATIALGTTNTTTGATMNRISIGRKSGTSAIVDNGADYIAGYKLINQKSIVTLSTIFSGLAAGTYTVGMVYQNAVGQSVLWNNNDWSRITVKIIN